MAFRATTVVTQQAFDELRRLAVASKAYLQNRRNLLIQATVSSSVLIELINHYRTTLAAMAALASTPGLAAYAQAQVNDPTYDIVAEYVAMRDAMTVARDELIVSFPKDGSGFLLYQQLTGDGTIVLRTFTTAQVASVVSRLDAVVASIQ